MTYSVDKIYTKHFLDIDYNVKAEYVYTKDTLIEWLNILYSHDYEIAVYKVDMVMLKHRTDSSDIFIIFSKWHITKSLLHQIFYFDDIISLTAIKELYALIEQ